MSPKLDASPGIIPVLSSAKTAPSSSAYSNKQRRHCEECVKETSSAEEKDKEDKEDSDPEVEEENQGGNELENEPDGDAKKKKSSSDRKKVENLTGNSIGVTCKLSVKLLGIC